MRRRLRILSGVLIVATSVPGSVASQGLFASRGEVYSFGDVSFPSVVDTFAVTQTVRYPETSLGVLLRYVTPLDPTARLDLYVYPAEARLVAGEDAALSEEFDVAVEGMQVYARQMGRAFELLAEERAPITVEDAAGVARRAWRVEASVRERGVEQMSFLYVFIKDGSFFKYRISYAAGQGDEMRGRAGAFVAETLALVTGPPRGPS